MLFLRIACICFAFSVTFAAPAAGQTVVIDSNFNRSVFKWRGPSRTLVMWRAVIIDGRIAICGAFGTRGSSDFRYLSRDEMRDLRIEYQGRVFLRGLQFFAEVSTAGFDRVPTGETARCHVSNTSAGQIPLGDFSLGFTPQRWGFHKELQPPVWDM